MPSSSALVELQGQHTRIDALLAELLGQVFDVGHREQAAESLRVLIVEMSMHFGYEESLMEAGGYPEGDHHRRQHIALVTELGLLLDRVEEMGDVGEVVRGVDFLTHWVEQHIAHSDGLLIDWLASAA